MPIVPPPIPSDRSSKPPREAGLKDYLKEAFFFRWNMLLFLGGLAGAAIAPLPDVTFPLVFAGELAYLAALTSLPRFRAAIDPAPAMEPLFGALAAAKILHPHYGTRCSTILLRDRAGRVRYAERSFAADGSDGETRHFEFQ